MIVLSIQLFPTGEVNIGLKKQPTFNDATNGLPTKMFEKWWTAEIMCEYLC